MSLHNIYRKLASIGLLFLSLLILNGCAVNNEQQVAEDARRYSAVTRIDPGFRPNIGDKLMWYGDIIVEDGNSDVKATEEQRVFMKSAIERELMQRLYQFTDEAEQADFVVAAAVLLDNSSRSQEINNLVQIYPGLADAFNDYEQGTLLMIIIPPAGDPSTSPILWRGAIQAYTLGDALPQQAQLNRLGGIIARLVSSVPRAGD